MWSGEGVVVGTKEEDWLDAGEPRNMFLGASNYNPLSSVQAGLVLTNFDDPKNPLRHKWSFMGSTDTHTARAGNGFKQVSRQVVTDVYGVRSFAWRKLVTNIDSDFPVPKIVKPEKKLDFFQHLKKNYYTRWYGGTWFLGGIAAVHTEGRSRDAVWDALKRGEVYGTKWASDIALVLSDQW